MPNRKLLRVWRGIILPGRHLRSRDGSCLICMHRPVCRWILMPRWVDSSNRGMVFSWWVLHKWDPHCMPTWHVQRRARFIVAQQLHGVPSRDIQCGVWTAVAVRMHFLRVN